MNTEPLRAATAAGLRAPGPEGLPRPRRRRRLGLVLLSAAFVLAAVSTATAWLAQLQKRNSHPELVTHHVQYEQLQPTLTVRGNLESAVHSDVVCRVRSYSRGSTAATTIKWIIEEGSYVKRGQLLVELDDSGLEEDLQQQKIVKDQAWATWVQAEENFKIVASQARGDIATAAVAVQLAELDLKKYLQGDYEQARKDLEGKLFLADADLEAWRERTAWSERMVRKGYVATSQARGERSRLDSAAVTLDKLREEMRVLQQYTRRRSETELQGKLTEARNALDRVQKQARAKELQADTERLTYKAIYQKREARYHEVEEQIRHCLMTAPQDGMVVYCVPEQSRYGGGMQQSIIAQGEPVREGQKLIHLPDLSKMVVKVRVHEASVARVRGEQWQPTGFSEGVEAATVATPNPWANLAGALAFAELRDYFRERDRRLVHGGQPALVHVDAYPDLVLHGHVKEVAVLPSQSDWSMADVRVYQTVIALDDAPDDLRPDMSAEVTVLLDEGRDHVLTVPVQALVGTPEMGRQRRCFVLTDNGPEERGVVVGTANDKVAEIQSGLSEGDEVVLNPRALALAPGVNAAP